LLLEYFYIADDHVYLHLETPAAETAKRRSARHSILKIQMFAESSSVAEELERTCSSLSDYEEEEQEEVEPTPAVTPVSFCWVSCVLRGTL